MFEPEFYFRSINLESRRMLLIRIKEVPVADSVSRLPSTTGQEQFPLRDHAAISCWVNVWLDFGAGRICGKQYVAAARLEPISIEWAFEAR